MEAPQIVDLINRYLEKMTDTAVRHERTIDESTSDEILFFFGIPPMLSDYTMRTVLCALEMQEAMKELNNETSD